VCVTLVEIGVGCSVRDDSSNVYRLFATEAKRILRVVGRDVNYKLCNQRLKQRMNQFIRYVMIVEIPLDCGIKQLE